MVRRQRSKNDVVILSGPGDVIATVQRHNDLFCIIAHRDGIVIDAVEARKLRDFLVEEDL